MSDPSPVNSAATASTKFSEDAVHEYIFKTSLEHLIDDVDESRLLAEPSQDAEGHFPLWQIVKARIVNKLIQLHRTVRNGTFVGSKVKLPIDKTRPMELDLLGWHEGGIFVLELKVGRNAERNAFSELFAYSNYVAQMFALSGPRDITNVLVANLDVKITREAYLYDLRIGDRDVIVYKPVFTSDAIESLKLHLHIPADEDFQHLTNRLFSEQAMTCVVASFDDLPGWFDNEETDGELNSYTRDHLSAVSSHAAQLMEAEHLHGFCYMRKRWKELPFLESSALIMCAVNPFHVADPDLSGPLLEQIDEEHHAVLFDAAESAFLERLIGIAQRALEDGLPHGHRFHLETPAWSGMVHTMIETVFAHNFGFHATGHFREAYVANLNRNYARRAAGEDVDDVSTMKAVEHGNWLRAWTFIEACGFVSDDGNDGGNV